jgi:SAM-dependent methyltransferase
MPIAYIRIPVFVPRWLFPVARKLYRKVVQPEKRPGPTMTGDRDVEYSFILANLPSGPGKAMDFGSGPALLSLEAAERGYEVTALDMLPYDIYWRHPAVKFAVGDVLSIDLPEEHFDVVMNCSAVEHVGLAGRYAVKNQRDFGDLEAMQAMRRLLKPGGMMLLTVPCGRDAVFAPYFRVYGEQRLPQLLRGFELEKQEFWLKDAADRWELCDPTKALSCIPSSDPLYPLYNFFALGCFVLRRPRVDLEDGKNGNAAALRWKKE